MFSSFLTWLRESCGITRDGQLGQWGQVSPGGSLLLLATLPIFIFFTPFFSVLIALFIGILSFFIGASFRLYLTSINDDRESRASPRSERDGHAEGPTEIPPEPVHYEPTSEFTEKEPRGKLDMRLSGSAIIDEIIHEMIDYVLRDYVHSWYDFISDEDEFIHQLRKAMQETLVNLSSRVKEIDWTPYLTTQLVDDGASHLRLYRTALAKVKENPNLDLLSVFFDLEASMEKNLCRDMACIDDSHLNDYFQGLAETILYLLLPGEVYACTPVGALAQDLLVNYILIPVLNLLSEPDFVNQYIIWLCQGFPVSSETFLSVIRTSDNLDEMTAAYDFFHEQHAELKSACERAASAEELSSLKTQLKCVNVIRKSVETRLSFLKEGGGQGADWTDEGEGWQNYFMTPGIKLHLLSLEDVLKNSVAVSYFLDYMNGVGGSNTLLMYFNTAAWKSLAEQQFSSIEDNEKGKDQLESNKAMMECLKSAATNVFNEFIPDTAVHKVRLPESAVRRFCIQMQTSSISPALFDDIYECLLETMECNEKYYQSFLKSKHYIKCLMDLDLLRTESSGGVSDDEDEEGSLDDYDMSSVSDEKRSQGDEYQTCLDCLKVRKLQEDGLTHEDILLWERGYLERRYRLQAEIIEAGLTTEKGKQFGVYAIQVVRIELWDGRERRWHIYRRFSDFYDFHQWIKSKWMRLNKIEFPSKHTFRSTDRMFLERRMGALNKYLETILAMTSEKCFGESLRDALLHFLEPGNYMIKKKQFSEKIETLVNPLKLSVKTVTSAVKSAPDTFISTLDGFTKMFYTKASEPEQIAEAMKVGASIDIEVDDNIPLRIILLLMDEVFDLKQRNQWLRRRIVAFCREILKAMFGDTINRRIIDHVAFLTNPVKVSGYLRNLKRALWPEGKRSTTKPTRDNDIKMRTRISAKASLIACISDELKRLMGSETTKRGLLSVFDLCQNRILNRRFVLVLLEGILKTLFADKPIMASIQRLHFRSNRVGKNRPFLIPSAQLKVVPNAMASLSPRGSRKKKT